MSSVYIAVNGSGLGHASRMIAIANELQLQGKEVSFCSSSEAIMMIRKSGFKCYETPLIDVEWTSSGEVAPLRITILRLVKDIPIFFKQIILELRNLKNENPRIVISDSKLGVSVLYTPIKLKTTSSPVPSDTPSKLLIENLKVNIELSEIA